MKLQFNLLPDVKQEYLKTRKTKRTVVTACVIASSVALFILLFALTTVYVINKSQIHRVDDDIKKYSKELQGIKNLDKILTIQNQLKSIGNLHQNKHKMSRIYTFLPQVTPSHVCITQLTVDAVNGNMSVQGNSDSQKSINTFIDTLKFTKYSVEGKNTGQYAFPSVVETQFGINSTASTNVNNKVKCQDVLAPASYQLAVKFEPTLFSNSSDVALVIPSGLVTTRSVLDDPSNIFNGDPNAPLENNSNSTTNSTNSSNNSGAGQ